MAPLPRRVIGNYEEVTYPPLNANCVVVGACSSKFRIHARKNLLPRTDCFGPGDDRVANFRSLLITAHQESGTEIGKCNCKLSRRLNSLCTPLRMVLPVSDCERPETVLSRWECLWTLKQYTTRDHRMFVERPGHSTYIRSQIPLHPIRPRWRLWMEYPLREEDEEKKEGETQLNLSLFLSLRSHRLL